MQVANLDLLAKAFEAIGLFNVTKTATEVRGGHDYGLVYWSAGKLYMPDKVNANAIKRAYAAEAIKYAAKAKNWSVKEQSKGKFLVTKGAW